ncbi:terpenoid synthase [Laetiporus sulphureus 93-53]|uniref:Terpene synthase n=1 Tax=Laetiporus sulphureus 93-53 TaxID=1314785 RepID=A0A165ET52_9APHY|nr:terpenoid synthase [Laetiporus sulphureus 93-53]KZT07703.1 terpenoid synthase [Laetiporus sulphureus 93-53]
MQQFVLPDLLALLPFKGSFNPHYDAVAAESSSWVNGYRAVSDRKRAFFLQGGSELLCAHAYPYASAQDLRTCFDLVNILFTVDEISDEQNGKDAYSTGRIFLNAMKDPDWNDGSALAKMCKEFRQRLLRYNMPACYSRLLKHCEDYVNAFAEEAGLRERNEVLHPDSYMILRRENSAVRFCFGLFGFVLGHDLPDEIFNDPVLLRMHLAAVDMVCWSNDIYSYNMEQAMGHTGNNIMTVLMKAHNCDLQAAADMVGEHFKKLMDSFYADKAQIRSWGPEMDAVVAKFVMAMENWVIGNCEWSSETLRYFGPERHEIKRTRIVRLKPKRED